MMIRSTILMFAFAAIAAQSTAFQNGDSCGVTSSDFLTYSYRSEYLVAGAEGCTLGEDDTNCYCAPDLADGESLSEWKWQCNNVSVVFGPAEQKVCPDSVPVPKEFGSLDVVLNRRRALQGQQQQQRVACDTAVHPTGRPGDEVCPYSDCDEGGDHSAICACIDLEQYGMGEGMEWVCMHATCSCGEDDKEQTDGDVSSAMTLSSVASIALMAILSWAF
ncbi:MAG: hypothetical protein SGILL_005152 [Bacillariaceae sp.]